MLQVALIIYTAFCIFVAHSAPPKLLQQSTVVPTTAQTTIPDFEPISLEGLDYILKRAEKLFRISDYTEQQQPKPEPYLRLNERLQPPNNEPYNFYLPVYTSDQNNYNGGDVKMDINSKNLLKFSPPEKSYEHNYYASKPKKIPKKYSAAIKHVNINIKNPQIQNEWEAIFNNNNYEDNTKVNDQQKIIFDDSFFGIDAHVPIPDVSQQPQVQESQPQATSVYKSNFNYDDMDDREEGEKELPTVFKREQEQDHSFDGPKSYKFGYNTGKGKNRQFRFEERNTEGDVKGQYGYTDKFGKMRIVKYSSSADKGFQIIH